MELLHMNQLKHRAVPLAVTLKEKRLKFKLKLFSRLKYEILVRFCLNNYFQFSFSLILLHKLLLWLKWGWNKNWTTGSPTLGHPCPFLFFKMHMYKPLPLVQATKQDSLACFFFFLIYLMWNDEYLNWSFGLPFIFLKLDFEKHHLHSRAPVYALNNKIWLIYN